MERARFYVAIDLKSFYASVECTQMGLNPLDACLVVADESRTEKTICLAVTPALKSYGIGGRARLFEVVEKVKQVNAQRLNRAPGHRFSGKSHFKSELDADPSLELSFIAAKPRMSMYMDYSRRIVSMYTKYVSFEDIHVYSVDEVFIDLSPYLDYFKTTPRELSMRIINDIYTQTGITATAGIGTNLYLSKVAMDIVAKHMPADQNGVRIAQLDEMSYRKLLWEHRPLTDFWRVGKGTQRKLEANGLYTMGDVARCSLGKADEHYNEEMLYRLFGVNAELLIDHAWGCESCEIKDIKAYRSQSNSLSQGQVLAMPYETEKARLIVKEMALSLSYQLLDKGLITDKLSLSVCYDIENLNDPERMVDTSTETDFYGRVVPKTSHGSKKLKAPGANANEIARTMGELFDEIVKKSLLVRRMYVAAENVRPKDEAAPEQLSLFDYAENLNENEKHEKDDRRLKAVMDIKRRYGNNAIVMGMSLEDGATGMDRNSQVGGHRA